MIRLGILATHPIQYHAPLFRELAKRNEIDLTVVFCHKPSSEEQGAGFGVAFQWDAALTEGYPHMWLTNRSSRPSVVSFRGCDTPGIDTVIREQGFAAFLVHGWYTKSCWQAFRACRRAGIPLLVRSDSQLTAQRSRMLRLVKRIVYPRFIKRFDVCLAYGQRSAEYFRHYGAKRVEISPHIVDNDWFSEKASEVRARRDSLRSQWGLDREAFVFLFVGKFEPKKRPLDAIHALTQVARRGPREVALLMVGEGVLRPECERLVAEESLPVRFAGFLNQGRMPEAYAVSDCLILPSDGRETWGLTVNEAMACGLPAIVSEEAGCVPDLIIDGETGYSYPCGDIETLSEQMRRVAGDPGLARALGTQAHTHIQGYDVRRAADEIARIVQHAAAQR